MVPCVIFSGDGDGIPSSEEILALEFSGYKFDSFYGTKKLVLSIRFYSGVIFYRMDDYVRLHVMSNINVSTCLKIDVNDSFIL